jgi:hypothetical protein
LPTRHEIQIQATADAPPGAAPELAALRVIAYLSARWTVVLLGCTDSVATIEIITVVDCTLASVEQAVDETLTRSALVGWYRR